MASLHDYGPRLLGSRLRKVSETLLAGVDRVYRAQGVTLPAACFPVLFLLRDQGRLGISDLAARLGQTHPAVSQMSRKLLAHGVVREFPDRADRRRRLLGLSPQGAALMRRLGPTWQALDAAVLGLAGYEALSAALTALDTALSQRDFASRIGDRLRLADVEVIEFEARHARDFRRLNLEWLRRYFRVEPVDERVLSAPQAILDAGGVILLARRGRRIVGTGALIVAGRGVYELSKMAVTAREQGAGVGRRLLEALVGRYQALGGRRLYLETNRILTPAIALYESVGFRHAPRPGGPSPYARADVYMRYDPPAPARRA